VPSQLLISYLDCCIAMLVETPQGSTSGFAGIEAAAGPAALAGASAGELALAQSQALKASGNDAFREGSLEVALHNYGEALQILETCGLQDFALRATLASNQAICLLKLDRPGEAEERASAALAADPGHSKAVYRRGWARLLLGDGQGAWEDLQKAVRLEPQNREVRARCEEARRLAATAAPDDNELSVAEHAAAALGAGGGLYEEKHDVNEGRLAETHKEQRDWISGISAWAEISDVAFADEQDKSCISVYMTLPGVHEIPANKVCIWFRASSLEVRVVDLNGKNWCWVAQELWGQIDPDRCTYKIRRDKLSLKLSKRQSARSWDRWEKLRRI